MHSHPQQAVIHQHAPHIHPTHGGHGHSHQHHHGPPPIHIHQFVPAGFAGTELGPQVQTEQPISLLTGRPLTHMDELPLGVGGGGGAATHAGLMPSGLGVLTCATQVLAPPSPEVLVVEKKFRNAMKTQATQTEVRKDGFTQVLALSPRTVHKVKVVSQGAQTNGLLNGKKLAKSLSEMPNGKALPGLDDRQIRNYIDHNIVYRTQSEEPPKSPLELDDPSNIKYYDPPPPLDTISYYSHRSSQLPSEESMPYFPKDVMAFDYESNSLPRRACTFHRESSFSSNSLPRRESQHAHEICKHITECTELMDGSNSSGSGNGGLLDFSKPHLLPPPSEYCKDADEPLTSTSTITAEPIHEPEPAVVTDVNRRKSMVATLPPLDDDVTPTPFRRDDIRRQSMPVYVKTEKLIDGFGPRTSFRSKAKPKTVIAGDVSDEKEIFIDFKPNISAKVAAQLAQAKHRTLPKQPQPTQKLEEEKAVEECENCRALQAAEPRSSVSEDDYDQEQAEHEQPTDAEDADKTTQEESDQHDPLYENVPGVQKPSSAAAERRASMRKRSVSLDEQNVQQEKGIGVSAPPSPCREELLFANASTYPSSDSLANDVTRDHSDGIWNESQVTVLTAEPPKEGVEGTYTSANMLLTPTTRRKNLLLQHQQRSSIDTDALDLEDAQMDLSPTYGIAVSTLPPPIPKSGKSSALITQQPQATYQRESKTSPSSASSLTVPPKITTPSIAVTPSLSVSKETLPKKSPGTSKRVIQEIPTAMPREGRRASDVQQARVVMDATLTTPQASNNTSSSNNNKFNNTTDVSECSTNTDEYATCTDTSKRTPVSTQSSQIDRTQGSSFESASSLYSTRGEVLYEELLQHDEKPSSKSHKLDRDFQLKSPVPPTELTKRSPSHSISSTSSGSYNVAGLKTPSPSAKHAEKRIELTEKSTTALTKPPHTIVASGGKAQVMGATIAIATKTTEPSMSSVIREKTRIKPESISDDERSEVRYSSSGYYESPHDEDNVLKSRRHRLDEERKRRKTTMKLDIEKENLRALTSPIKKPASTLAGAHATPLAVATAGVGKEKLPEKQSTTGGGTIESTSPNRIKRFRPKIRRQFRRSSRDDSAPKRQKNLVNLYGIPPSAGSNEKLLDYSVGVKKEEKAREDLYVSESKTVSKVITSPTSTTKAATTTAAKTKSSSEVCQLKAKSIESLRSVSPGSDSVFYSEADGPLPEPHSHCLHCGKGAEGQTTSIIALAGDSVESLPYIEHEIEQDIVKPPSDFADSPVTAKTTQRLYKKMDKRFRSEDRYHGGERGRHYKTRQENIRAKSEERSRDNVHTRSPQSLRPAGSSPCVLPDATADQSQIVYRGHYDPAIYSRLTDEDIWAQLTHQSFDRFRDRRPSTDSERSFHAKFQVILHRLIQRRCTLEMYHRQRNNNFRVDKSIVVKSESGEFGFRIHGSKPVVVAAIEPDTPAENSGLEVGDIIISVNGIEVLDKNHTEVVKIAHEGCETLELEVARTIGVLMHEQEEPQSQPIYSGYLWRQSGQAKGAPNTKKWVRRWFSLRPDNCLYYYKTEDDNQPVGAMIMAKHTVDHCPPEVGKPHAFKIDPGEGIPLYVAADSEELSSRWIKLLKQAATQTTPWLDNCAQNIYKPPCSIIRPDCFGYLLKLGSRWCGWSKRYCVLKDACLYFYQDANSKTAFGMACLHGYKVQLNPTIAAGKKYSFEIAPPDPARFRPFYCCAESEMDRKRWVSALEYSIDRWIKSG
uniref:Putative serine/threonine-protein kinase DDB-G0272282 n=1 Tax=Ceratitis capitata TaxID=7213 RepID=W8AIV7_CERCA